MFFPGASDHDVIKVPLAQSRCRQLSTCASKLWFQSLDESDGVEAWARGFDGAITLYDFIAIEPKVRGNVMG